MDAEKKEALRALLQRQLIGDSEQFSPRERNQMNYWDETAKILEELSVELRARKHWDWRELNNAGS